jgi:hypothetical protein
MLFNTIQNHHYLLFFHFIIDMFLCLYYCFFIVHPLQKTKIVFLYQEKIFKKQRKDIMAHSWKTPTRSGVPVMTPTVRKWMESLYVVERLHYWVLRTFEDIQQNRADPTFWWNKSQGLKTKRDWRELIMTNSDILEQLKEKIEMYRRDYDILSPSDRKKLRQQISFVLLNIEQNLYDLKRLVEMKMPPPQRTMRSATLNTIRERETSYRKRRLSQRMR